MIDHFTFWSTYTLQSQFISTKGISSPLQPRSPGDSPNIVLCPVFPLRGQIYPFRSCRQTNLHSFFLLESRLSRFLLEPVFPWRPGRDPPQDIRSKQRRYPWLCRIGMGLCRALSSLTRKQGKLYCSCACFFWYFRWLSQGNPWCRLQCITSIF